jgi:Flp pilus assembly protein TadD
MIVINEMGKERLPDSYYRIFAEAQDQARSGNKRIAINMMQSLAQEYPKLGLLRAVLAKYYWDIGDLFQAELEFRKAVEACPKNEKCSLGLFHILWEQDKQFEALEEMKRFLNISNSVEYQEILRAINDSASRDQSKNCS